VRSWVLLLYKIPPEPTAKRVQVWRKLKRLGALLLHDAVWVLPATPYTVEQFQWLAAEIREMEGSATAWEARLYLADEDDRLAAQFLAQTDAIYREILAVLAEPNADLTALSRRFQQAYAQDYFHSSLGDQVRSVLIEAKGGLDS
jgi:hypothetical protein